MVKSVKIILAGEIDRAVNVSGLLATKGALEAIVKAGGTVQSVEV
jgi:large subunit ribosomal protein L15